ncbi:DUF6313 family protein [Streptomyces sp. NPDC097610]|uniref:DUF6313 family protein n=1 Tax=Streptomyces sp. NPDC097610 TaxID=3157227 RepID=UPI00331DE1FA
MRSLDDLAAEGGAAAQFVYDFVNNPHRGDLKLAKDHWTRTVQYIANNDRSLESLNRKEAERQAENTARMFAHSLARLHNCWACGETRTSTFRWRRRHD